MDPSSVAALEDYDAARMPELMDAQVRAVLEGSAPDLGPSTFEALMIPPPRDSASCKDLPTEGRPSSS